MKPRPLLLWLDVLVLAQSLYYYPRLPLTVASHFDAAGQANGWSTRTLFFLMQLSVAALVTAIFLGIPLLLRRVPTSLFNLFNKEYWLAPDRRPTTIADLENRCSWFGVATITFLLVIFQLAIAANLESNHRLAHRVVWPMLAAYVVVVLYWTARLIVRYARVDHGDL